LGYAQLGAFLHGEITLDESVAAIKRETRRFVRQQANWFKPRDPPRDVGPTRQQGAKLPEPHNVRWFDAVELEPAAEAIEQFVRDRLANRG
jgi:tRNA A37 N6-isopentenylltransferase MiaA